MISLWIGDIDYGNSIVVMLSGMGSETEESETRIFFSGISFKLCAAY